MNRQLRIGLALLGILLLFALFGVLLARLRPYAYHGRVLDPPLPAADLALTGPGGAPVRLSDFRGRAVALYFGYTSCPDVCPTTMAELAQAMRLLGEAAGNVQVIMVTVDPERDTADVLQRYVTAFDPRFIGLTGSADEIAAAAAAFDIFYEKHEGTTASGYLVDHTASTTVLDAQGRRRLVWPYGTPADAIAADLQHLIRTGR